MEKLEESFYNSKRMNTDEIKIFIKTLILNESKSILHNDDLNDSYDLLTTKIMDSITFIKVISKLEKEFNIEFSITDLAIKKFQNIKMITEEVEKKLGASVISGIATE